MHYQVLKWSVWPSPQGSFTQLSRQTKGDCLQPLQALCLFLSLPIILYICYNKPLYFSLLDQNILQNTQGIEKNIFVCHFFCLNAVFFFCTGLTLTWSILPVTMIHTGVACNRLICSWYLADGEFQFNVWPLILVWVIQQMSYSWQLPAMDDLNFNTEGN